MFDRHLRQKQAATAMHTDQQPVMANFHGVGKNWPGRCKDTEFNLQLMRFFSCHGLEASVVKCCSARRFCDGTINRAGRQHIPDASSQCGVPINRSESAPRLGQVGGGRIKADFPAIQRGKDRLMRQPQQYCAFFGRKLVARRLAATRLGASKPYARSRRIETVRSRRRITWWWQHRGQIAAAPAFCAG